MRCKILFLTCWALAAAVPARALVLAEVQFEDLVRQADGIFEGRIVDKHAAWNAEHTLILTHYTLEVQRTLAGFPDSQIRFTEIGGAIDGVTMWVEGTPSYELDEQVVIFLHGEKGRVMTLRWTQGKFPVRQDWSGRKQVLMPDREVLGLDEFTRRVQELQIGGGRP